jgi:hypothetical protein
VRLARLLARVNGGIALNEHVEAEGATVFAEVCRMGLEGIVSKTRPNGAAGRGIGSRPRTGTALRPYGLGRDGFEESWALRFCGEDRIRNARRPWQPSLVHACGHAPEPSRVCPTYPTVAPQQWSNEMANKNRLKNKKAIKQAAQVSPPAARKSTNPVAPDRGPDSDAATQMNAESNQRSSGIAEQTVQSGASFAERLTETPVQQPSASDFSKADGEKIAPPLTSPIEAAQQSGTVMSEMFSRLFREWSDFASDRQARNVSAIKTLMGCRTPQDFVALQCALMRDNIEGLLAYGRRLGEKSS